MAESDSKFFSQNIEEACKFAIQVMQNAESYQDDSIPSLALELFCTLAEKRPKFFRNRKDLCQSLSVAIGTRMLMTSHEVEQDWQSP